MKAVHKTYKCNLHFNTYVLSVTVNGKPMSVEFVNGTKVPFYNPARYATSDPKIQEAIEKSSVFGKDSHISIDRVREYDIPDPVKEEATAKTTQQEAIAAADVVKGVATTPEQQEQLEVKDGITEVAGISSGQKAKDYIKEHYPDITFAQLRTNNAVKQVAKSLNIAFPDWKE